MRQTVDHQSPFDREIDGFNPEWWFSRKERAADNSRIDYVKFLANGIDVARAEVVPRRLSNSYQFLSSERSVLEVSFF